MKITNSKFLELAELKHGKKYDYSKLPKYLNSDPKIKIFCEAHDCTFEQTIQKHLAGQTGCKKCVSDSKRKLNSNTTEFILKAEAIHGTKYNYDKVVYVKSTAKILIGCRNGHGYFEMTPANHTNKTKPQGCKHCSGKTTWTKESFIETAQGIHYIKLPKYDYSQVEYKDNTKHVIIICEKHGPFKQTPQKHLAGQKCKYCANEIVANKNRQTTSGFIEKARKVHADKYDYSLVDYKNNNTKIDIVCKYCGTFEQTPSSHLQGSGCPVCTISKGEEKTASFLEKNGIQYKRQYQIEDNGKKSSFRFDFMFELKGSKYLVEYNGEQHYRAVKYSKKDLKSEKRYSKVQQNDKAKIELAKKYNYKLITIKYDDPELKGLSNVFK